MEEQKSENKEELQQETAEGKKFRTGKSFHKKQSSVDLCRRLSCVYRISSLCQCHKRSRRFWCGISGSGRYFVVIGAVLLIMAIRNLAKAGAQKHELEEAAAKKASENAAQNLEISEKKKMSIAERAHLTENLDDAPDEKDEK